MPSSNKDPKRLRRVCVIGCDDENTRLLEETIHDDPFHEFHCVADFEEVVDRDRPAEDLTAAVLERCERMEPPPDGFVGWWDLPVTCLVPMVARRLGAPGPSLESVLRCEHKYWSRLEQREVLDCCPDFAGIDPFAENPRAQIPLDYPFWLKPVKATDSDLGFEIGCDADFDVAIERIREGIGKYGEPMNYFLSQADVPERIAHAGGNYCLAEQLVEGQQCTVSGYVHGGKAECYGVVDSLNYPGTTSFQGYVYPSALPARVQERLTEQSVRIMEHIGNDQAAFNIEYFYNDETDQLWLLEINPRISQSHAWLYQQVDGVSNQRLIVELALGEAPRNVSGAGPFEYAGKFFIRHFENARVADVPSEAEIQAVRDRHPGAEIHLNVDKGTVLEDTLHQDSYSYVLALVMLADKSREALLEQFEKVREELRFELESPNGSTGS